MKKMKKAIISDKRYFITNKCNEALRGKYLNN